MQQRDQAPEILIEVSTARSRSPRQPRCRWTRHASSTATDANRWSQYVPGGNTAEMPFRQRLRALAYSTVNARLRSSASIRAHLFRDATRARRFRRGSTLAG